MPLDGYQYRHCDGCTLTAFHRAVQWTLQISKNPPVGGTELRMLHGLCVNAAAQWVLLLPWIATARLVSAQTTSRLISEGEEGASNACKRQERIRRRLSLSMSMAANIVTSLQRIYSKFSLAFITFYSVQYSSLTPLLYALDSLPQPLRGSILQ